MGIRNRHGRGLKHAASAIDPRKTVNTRRCENGYSEYAFRFTRLSTCVERDLMTPERDSDRSWRSR